MTVFERVGGASAVRAVVELFYERVLADAEVAGYFTGVDMAAQRRHLASMLTVVLGGPDGYTGRGLSEAHQRLGVTDGHYARVGEHLTAALAQVGAPAEVVAEVRVVLGRVRDQVVSAGPPRA
ncbi:group I truncated hemoglobin [Micromonospora sp. NBS 11-29]|uniref:group I truncated hemoglobin n=1 Tax=Micromonospora sp. NBS 11-29 TaxID=1960879 RepID=UPI000B76F68E|nr:group 1 truncated hemoglobin [Micromonospora sp. NBS 11-29]